MTQPSSTALAVSVVRAVHQLIDERPLILEDPISPLLFSADAQKDILAEPERYRTAQARGLRSHVVLRSRYAEDQLREAVKAGISQFVSLGAGFDTFAFRQPQWAGTLQVLEVDHPDTQRAKIEHFRRQGIPFPENVGFLGVDLERDDLSDRLWTSPIRRLEPVFVSCLGVLAYLGQGAIKRVLSAVAQMGRGSILLAAFAPRDTGGSGENRSAAAEAAAASGEPWLSYFTEEELRGELVACGFSAIGFLRAEEAAQRYYRGRTDLPAPRRTRLCACRV